MSHEHVDERSAATGATRRAGEFDGAARATGQRRAIEEKCRLYLDIGVEGVWICEKDGTLRFCNADGVIETLRVAEAAPGRISTDIYP